MRGKVKVQERKQRSIEGHEFEKRRKKHLKELLNESEADDELEFGIVEYEKGKEIT